MSLALKKVGSTIVIDDPRGKNSLFWRKEPGTVHLPKLNLGVGVVDEPKVLMMLDVIRTRN